MESVKPSTRRRIALCEAIDIVRGKEERHRRLHGRLLAVLVITFVLAVCVSLVMWWLEPGKGLGGSFGNSALWVSSEILTGSSSLSIYTPFGHVIEVAMQLYMVTVMAAIAGSFASYFTSG